jgi:hypothetical protein
MILYCIVSVKGYFEVGSFKCFGLIVSVKGYFEIGSFKCFGLILLSFPV